MVLTLCTWACADFVLCHGVYALQSNLLATCGADATVQLFDLGSQRQLTTLTGGPLACPSCMSVLHVLLACPHPCLVSLVMLSFLFIMLGFLFCSLSLNSQVGSCGTWGAMSVLLLLALLCAHGLDQGAGTCMQPRTHADMHRQHQSRCDNNAVVGSSLLASITCILGWVDGLLIMLTQC
jgi:hypothetical protein